MSAEQGHEAMLAQPDILPWIAMSTEFGERARELGIDCYDFNYDGLRASLRAGGLSDDEIASTFLHVQCGTTSGARGSAYIEDDGTRIIDLFVNSDEEISAQTVTHEGRHIADMRDHTPDMIDNEAEQNRIRKIGVSALVVAAATLAIRYDRSLFNVGLDIVAADVLLCRLLDLEYRRRPDERSAFAAQASQPELNLLWVTRAEGTSIPSRKLHLLKHFGKFVRHNLIPDYSV